jgi:hypothetical protein
LGDFDFQLVFAAFIFEGAVKMNTGYSRLSIVTAVFLVLAVTQVYFGTGLAMASPRTEPLGPEPPPITAILMTRGNRPITVNGGNALSGATILTGSIIETPDQVGGVISLGSLSSLEIEPNSKVKLEFDENGNLKVTVMRGCATARTKKNVIAQIDTSLGVAGKTDPKSRGFLGVCFPPGATTPTVTTAPAGAAASRAGLGALAFILLLGGGSVAGILIAFRGTNPSPSGP